MTSLRTAQPAGPVATDAGEHQVAGFLARQVDALDDLDFVVVLPFAAPYDALEIAKLEEGGIAVRVPTRPPQRPLSMGVRQQLERLGYRAVDTSVALGERVFAHAPEAAAAAATLLRDVFGHDEHQRLDVHHGSRRPERDAARRLAELRAQIEPILAEFLGGPAVVDEDGDYLVPHGGLTVMVAPRAVPGGVPLVRVATITNLGINPTAEVGALLANLNFGIAFGRFAYDGEHRAIWFDETLLADDLRPGSLKLTVEVVAHTASEWVERFQQLFGGLTPAQAADVAVQAGKRRKPGEGATCRQLRHQAHERGGNVSGQNSEPTQGWVVTRRVHAHTHLERVHESAEKLSTAECFGYLREGGLGRVGLVSGEFAVMLPVNFVLDGTEILFLTSTGAKLAAIEAGAPITFEIDHLDAAGVGWSVLAAGPAWASSDQSALERLQSLGVNPAAPGHATHAAGIDVRAITGRRFGVPSARPLYRREP